MSNGPRSERGHPPGFYGANTLFRDRYMEEGYDYALLGLSLNRMAEVWGVAPNTVKNWLRDRPDFKERINAGRTAADSKVASGLYRKAVGYDVSVTSTDTTETVGEDGTVKTITKTSVKTLHFSPDVSAAQFWLRVRQGWRDNTEVDKAGVEIKITGGLPTLAKGTSMADENRLRPEDFQPDDLIDEATDSPPVGPITTPDSMDAELREIDGD